MTPSDPQRLQQALHSLFERAVRDARVAAEAQRARREFFGPSQSPGPPGGAASADEARLAWLREQRLREWFLLERESDTLGDAPATRLELQGDEVDLLESTVGVFHLTADGDGLLAHDLQHDAGPGGTEPLGLASAGADLQAGDVVVGRLYPGPVDAWVPSAAVAVYRPGSALARALRKDLGRLALGRRLTQQELEQLLLRRLATQGPNAAEGAAPRPVEHLEAELQSLLENAGGRFEATAVSEALLAAVRPGPVMGPLLDQLAFESEVDLERARSLLLALWNAHHADAGDGGGPPAAAARSGDPTDPGAADLDAGAGPPGETLGERLVRALDAGLAAHEDVEELFGRLEAMAGIEPEENEENDPADDARDAAVTQAVFGGDAGDDEVGDLAPLVQEYLWETGRGDAPSARTLQLFVQSQRNAPLPRTDLEQITARDLMRLLLHVYLGAAPADRAGAVRAAFDDVRAFYVWAEATQEMQLLAALDGCRGPLLDQLDRLQAVGLALSSEDPEARPGGARPPGLLRIEDIGDDGFGVRSDDGHHWIRCSQQTLTRLAAGDLLLGAVRAGTAGHDATLSGLVVALPRDADALIG